MDFQKKKVEPSKEDFKRIIKDKEKISLSKKVGEKKSYLTKNLFFQLMDGFQVFLEVNEY